MEWISVNDRLPNNEQEVMLCCQINRGGWTHRYQCIGFYTDGNMLRGDSEYNWDYEACDRYDEHADDYLVNKGWYERIHNWDEYSCVAIDPSDTVTHWAELPKMPEG